jgi:anti-anti-sigma regulatory factor
VKHKGGFGLAESSTVEDLRPGDHACLAFSDADERLDIVAAFVRDGLAAQQQVLCYVESSLPEAFAAELADRGLAVAEPVRTGQLMVTASGEHYLAGGAFAADRMISTLRSQLGRARAEGHTGLRVTADMCWALRPVAGIEQLIAYESEIASVLARSSALALCQYDRQRFDTVTLASVTAAHGRAVAAVTYHDDPMLRVCRQYMPPGIRVAGEIDFRHLEVLSHALVEAVAVDEVIHVNLRQLRFIDGATAGAIAQTAASLDPDRRMVVTCQPIVGKVLEVIGAGDVAQLRVVVRDVDR